VDPTRSTNSTVSWRRSASAGLALAAASAAALGSACGAKAGSARAAIASRSLHRCPTVVTPMSLRSSAVSAPALAPAAKPRCPRRSSRVGNRVAKATRVAEWGPSIHSLPQPYDAPGPVHRHGSSGSWLCENGSSSPKSAISRRKCSVFVCPALLHRNSFSDRSAGCVFTRPGSRNEPAVAGAREASRSRRRRVRA
jgi:hypothetical protein